MHIIATVVAHVQSQFRKCGICVGQSGAGIGFLLIILSCPAAMIFLVLFN
jgi:hypothetical protein